MSDGSLRVGMIGAGAAARERHMPGFAALPEVEVVAVWARRPDSARQFAEEFSVPRAVYTWQDITGMDEVDAVCVATPPALHRPVVLAALEAGKHVLCQWPMCLNLDEARHIAATANRHPDFILRFCPSPMGLGGDRTMRRLLHEEHAIGDVRQVTLTSVSGHLLDPDLELHWRLRPEQVGQNVLTLPFYLAVIERWIGPTRRVTAAFGSWTEARIDPMTRRREPVDLPESVNVVAEFVSGAIGVYLINGVSSHGPTDHLAIHGTKGTLVYDFHADPAQERIEMAQTGSDAPTPVEIPDSERGRWSAEAEFARFVRSGETPDTLTGIQYGCKCMSSIDAIFRSAANNRGVEVATD